MKSKKQSRRSPRNIVLAFALGGVTAFALMSRPAPSRAAERVQPAVSVSTPVAAGAPDARPAGAVADKDVCDLQLD
jgi:hypothetical protein